MPETSSSHPRYGYEGWRRAKLPAGFQGFGATSATCADRDDSIGAGPVLRVYGTGDPLDNRVVLEDRYHSSLPTWLTPYIHCRVENLSFMGADLPAIERPQ